MTMNNFDSCHWATKSKVKKEYSRLLNDWFLDDQKLPKHIHFEWLSIFKDKRKRDSINTARVAKMVEDILVKNGSLEDDDETSHYFLPNEIDRSLPQHELRMRIYDRDLKGDNDV